MQLAAAASDSDGDGLSDLFEINFGTNYLNADTNGNGMPDGEELAKGGNPAMPGLPPAPPPPPTNDPVVPADPPPAPPGFTPPADYDVLVRTRSAGMPKYGFDTFLPTSPPLRYLSRFDQDDHTRTPASPDFPYAPVSMTSTVDPMTGAETGISSVPGSVPDMQCTWPQSEEKTTLHLSVTGTSTNSNGFRDSGYSSYLNTENTTAAMVEHGKTKLGDFDGDYSPGTPFAYRNVHENELQFDYQKVEFKFSWHEGVPAESHFPVTYLVVFKPENDPATEENESETQMELVQTIPWDGENTQQTFTLDPDVLKPGKDGEYSLVSVDIAVDANRDGEVKLGSSTDKTTQDKPFRFWCNDDDDSGEHDHPGSSTKDSDSNTIVSLRDLEDFTRLHLNIGGLQDAIANGDIQVGLEWRNATGSPSIKVFQAAEEDGGDQYLKTDVAAGNQKTGTFGTALGTVSNGGSFKLPSSFWQSNLMGLPTFDADHPNRYLLFEGVAEGKGQLVMTFWKGSTRMGEGGGVWLDLVDVRKMYQRSYGKPREGSVAWKKPNEYNPYQEPVVSIALLDEAEFEKPTDETSDTIVLVHGIHAVDIVTEQQAINVYTQMASTAFKRLWWQGFKGRFAFYKWEAHNLAFFNESEYRAWKSGRGLAAFLNALPGQNKNVWTFSQGAVVGSAAIRDYGATPNAMIVMQAAIPAVCYDDEPALNKYPNTMPDTVAEFGYRGYHGATGTKIINFADSSDFATGQGWRAAQDIKPEPNYGYNPVAPAGQQLKVTYLLENGRFVTDLHESLSMIARSKSATIAHEPDAGGVTSSSIPLDTSFGFSNEHGAAFDRRIQNNLTEFYEEVLTQFGIPFNP